MTEWKFTLACIETIHWSALALSVSTYCHGSEWLIILTSNPKIIFYTLSVISNPVLLNLFVNPFLSVRAHRLYRQHNQDIITCYSYVKVGASWPDASAKKRFPLLFQTDRFSSDASARCEHKLVFRGEPVKAIRHQTGFLPYEKSVHRYIK